MIESSSSTSNHNNRNSSITTIAVVNMNDSDSRTMNDWYLACENFEKAQQETPKHKQAGFLRSELSGPLSMALKLIRINSAEHTSSISLGPWREVTTRGKESASSWTLKRNLSTTLRLGQGASRTSVVFLASTLLRNVSDGPVQLATAKMSSKLAKGGFQVH